MSFAFAMPQGRSGPGRFVGRVGALALALGVGAGLGALPSVACADTAGAAGTSDAAGPLEGPAKSSVSGRALRSGAEREGSVGSGGSATTAKPGATVSSRSARAVPSVSVAGSDSVVGGPYVGQQAGSGSGGGAGGGSIPAAVAAMPSGVSSVRAAVDSAAVVLPRLVPPAVNPRGPVGVVGAERPAPKAASAVAGVPLAPASSAGPVAAAAKPASASAAVSPVRALVRALSALGLNSPTGPAHAFEALGVLAWGMFRELEAGLAGAWRGIGVGGSAPVAAAVAAPVLAPEAVGWRAGLPESATGRISGSVLFTDPASKVLTYTVTTTSTGGGTVSVNRTTGAFVYTPTVNQRKAATGSTTDTFTVTASNGSSRTDQLVTVAVDAGTPVAKTPTAGSPNGVTGVVAGRAVFTDPAGRTLSFSAPVSGTSTGGGTVTVNPTTGAFTYTPTQSQRQAATASTTDTFTVTANNGVNGTLQLVTVSVGAGTPQASGTVTKSVPTPSTGVITGSPGFTDPVGRMLSFSAPMSSTGGGTVVVDPATGAYTYTPSQSQRQAAKANTTDTFTITASNGVNSAPRIVTVSVDPGTPVAGVSTKDPANPATGALGGNAVFTDTAGRVLTYSAAATSRAGATVSVDAATGMFVYTPTDAQRRTANSTTTDTFTVTASNGVRSETQKIMVSVRPSVPVAGGFTVAAPSPSTGALSGSVAVTDSSGQALRVTYSSPTTSTGGGKLSVNASTGAFRYTPTAAQRKAATATTTDTFTVSATNGVDVVEQIITVKVDPGTPVAGTVTRGAANPGSGAFSGIAAFTDPFQRSLTYSAPATSAGGAAISVNPLTGAYTYTPTRGQRLAATKTTTDTFTVTATNGVVSADRTVTVPVSYIAGIPVPGVVSSGTPDPGNGAITGAAAFTDPDGRTLVFSAPTTSTGGATVNLNPATGTFTYTPTLTQRQTATKTTTDTFTVTVTNGVNTATKTVTVGVDAGTPVAGEPSVGSPNGISLGSFTNVTYAAGSGLPSDYVLGVYVSGSHVYAATSGNAGLGGLAISSDGGTTFTTRTTSNGLGSNSVGGVYVSGSSVYAATQGGLSISTDGGSTFTTKTTSNGLGSNYVGGVYASGSTVYAATQGGLSISTDGGSTFTNKTTSNGLLSNNVYEVHVSGSTIYAATYGGGLSISTDGGSTFTTKTTRNGLLSDNVYAVDVSGSMVYAGTTAGLSISTDGGLNFTTKTTSNGLGSDIVFEVRASGSTVYAATAGGLSISIDGGSTFTNHTYTDGLGSNNLYGVYVSGSTVYAATTGGLSKATVSEGTGLVTGSAVFNDPVGRTLIYTTPGTSTGGGTVTVNASTGAFEFIPTAAQRLAATGSTTDTFTITASNGVNTTDEVVTVSVAATT